jgi:hypothetical protein
MAKEWSWSYSKKKNYDTCPKRHYEVDIQKNYKEDSEQLDWGNAVHSALANACTGKQALPATMNEYQRWIDVVRAAPGILKVEQKLAITRDFQPTEWFSNRAWLRVVVDVLKLHNKSATMLDWKTGKLVHDSIQLAISAQCVFVHFPEIEKVKTRFVWLKEECTTPDVFERRDMARLWTGLLPEINAMEAANKTLTYPPKPGKLCYKWCPVSSCPFHGKSNR